MPMRIPIQTQVTPQEEILYSGPITRIEYRDCSWEKKRDIQPEEK
jgi:hypothetical protein